MPVAVFGADDRVPVPPQYSALQEGIGLLINNRARTVCTAFCVAGDIIATAAHCLFKTKGEIAPRLADFVFARNFDRERALSRIAGHGNGTAPQNVLAGSLRIAVRPPIDAANDWALIRLARPVCSRRTLNVQPVPIAALIEHARAQRVFQISYHRDFTHWRPAYSRPCAVERRFDAADAVLIARDFLNPGDLVLHRCDTGAGSSGSPVFVDLPDGPAVVGINVGTYVQTRVLMQDGAVTQRLKPEVIANTAVAAAAFANKIEGLRNARLLSPGPQLRALQERLRERRLYSGPVDGNYGSAVKAAIEAYEKAAGLPALGLATHAVLVRLNAEGAQLGPEPPIPSPRGSASEPGGPRLPPPAAAASRPAPVRRD